MLKNCIKYFAFGLLSLPFFCANIFGQANHKIDSLLNVLDDTYEDSMQYALYRSIAGEYAKFNIDSAVIFADKSLDIAEETDNVTLIVRSNLTLGNLFFNQGNFNRAINYYFTALELNESSKSNYLDFVIASFNIGLVYKSLNDNERSQEYYFNALRYWEKAAENDSTTKDRIPLGRIYNNIGVTYHDADSIDLALNYFYEALKISDETNNSIAKPFAYNNIGLIYHKKGDFEIALSFYQKALDIRQEINDVKGIALIYSYMAESFLSLEQDQNAFEFFNLAFDLAESVNYSELQVKVSENLVKYYAESGQYKKSYEMHLVYKELTDNLDLIESSKNAAMLDMQYKFDAFQKEMALEQQRKNYITLMFFGLLITLLIVFTLLFFLTQSKVSRIRLQREKLLLEKDNLNSKLEYRNKELTTNVMYLVRKNELISSISERLLALKGDLTKVNQKPINEIIVELQRSVDDDVWEEFEYRFKEVHEDFYNTLNERFPDLSPNEKKLCAFLRLNMSTKEISAITFQSNHSITIARSRLRKKLDINNTDVNLVDFLMDL